MTSDHLNDEAALLWLEETWPMILRQAKVTRAVIVFGDEASFAQWGSIGYTWALKGVQPKVKTSGIHKAYRVFGLLDCFGGRLCRRGLIGKFNSDTYQEFLTWVLTQTTDHLIPIQDNVADHTRAAMHTFYIVQTTLTSFTGMPVELTALEGEYRYLLLPAEVAHD